MDNHQLASIMIALAVATPALGAVLLTMSKAIARDAGEAAAPIMRRAAVVLMVAGPLNLLLWLALNHWLDAAGYRSVLGYAVPAAAFLLVGWATGFFSRMRRKVPISGRRDRGSGAQFQPSNGPANREGSPSPDEAADRPARQ